MPGQFCTLINSKEEAIDLIYARERKADPDFAVNFDSEDAYTWNGDYWSQTLRIEEKRRASDWLEKRAPSKATDKQADALANKARTDALPLPKPDRRKVIIPLRGSYLHLERGDDGKHGFRVKTPDRNEGITFGVEAKCPVEAGVFWMPEGCIDGTGFGAFLNCVIPDIEVQRVVQEYFGVTFLPDSRHHKALCLIGRGRNGKGTLARLLKRTHRRTVAVDANHLAGFALEGAEDASLIISDEVKERGLASQDLKRCISGEPIQVNRKGRKVLTVELTAKWLLMTNHVPKLDDMTLGMLSRFIFVPMDVTIAEKDRVLNLDDALSDDELHVFVEWCLAGLLRVSDRGRMLADDELPESCRLLKDTVKTSSCSVAEWMDDLEPIVKDDAVLTSKMEIWTAYVQWAEERGIRNYFGEKAFWERMVQYLKLDSKTYTVRRVSYDGKRMRYVRLKVPSVRFDRFGSTDF